MTAETVMNARAVELKVWDPLVRIFHWSLAMLFLVAYVTGDEESRLHEWAGYGVLALVAVRVIWGFIGTRHARFGDFVYGPRAILAYVKELLLFRPKRYLGHNPLGGAMVVLMLVTLLATGLTGLALQQAGQGGGLLASTASATGTLLPVPIAPAHADGDEQHENDDGEEWLEEIHEFLANFMVLLVLVHVAGVALGSLMHRENLVRAMFTGRKHV